MLPVDPLAIRAELARVLASPGFAHNERFWRFLWFVVERHLEGREDEIKVSVIGVEVFRPTVRLRPEAGFSRLHSRCRPLRQSRRRQQ
jgi:hypothetical protein